MLLSFFSLNVLMFQPENTQRGITGLGREILAWTMASFQGALTHIWQEGTMMLEVRSSPTFPCHSCLNGKRYSNGETFDFRCGLSKDVLLMPLLPATNSEDLRALLKRKAATVSASKTDLRTTINKSKARKVGQTVVAPSLWPQIYIW